MRPALRASAFLLLFVLTFAPAARADNASLASAAASAVSESAAERDAAIQALRDAGPAGLDALFEAHADEIARQLSGADSARGAAWLRLAHALDRVSRQRDNFASRLFWHTDIEEAKRAARAEKKPILSLRLLGRLDEEFSCANSRFFRTALYANAEVSKLMRERFVLHWKSVRPAPRVTIDFGDGRRIETTVTGNSVHYVLDSEGWPVDALPGLYGPRAFARELARAESAARNAMRLAGAPRNEFLSLYHNARANELLARLRADAGRASVPLPPEAFAVAPAVVPQGTTPTAVRAMPIAMTKSGVESRIVRSVVYDPAAFAAATDAGAWSRLAALYSDDARLDAASLALLRRHNPYVPTSDDAKSVPSPEQLARVVRNFESRMALDTVRNEYLLRPRLLRWFLEGASRVPVEQLNARVYTELFLTPDSDPWLGLLPPDTYSGIEGDGVRRAR